jgi:hypothetical protein
MTPVDSVIEDCEGFTTWTAQVRMMQVLLEACRPCAGFRTQGLLLNFGFVQLSGERTSNGRE